MALPGPEASLRMSGFSCLASLDISKAWDHDSPFWFQSVGQTLLPRLLTDFVWSLLMKLSAPDQTTASEAATILKLTLEYYAHKVTMVRYLTMSRGVQNVFSNGLLLSLLYAYFFSYIFLAIVHYVTSIKWGFCVKYFKHTEKFQNNVMNIHSPITPNCTFCYTCFKF